jgi:hypothetical protein
VRDLGDRLRAEATRRADGIEPSDDLPDRIHAHVARRRRQRQLRAGALATGAAAVFALAVLALPGPDRTLETGSTDDPGGQTTQPGPTQHTATTGPPDVETSVPQPDSTEPTDTAPTTNTTGGPPDTPSPAPSATATTATTATAPPGLEPPDSQQPASGVCPRATEAAVQISLNPDVPSPRCARVGPDQTLSLANATDQQAEVTFAGRMATIPAGSTRTFDQPFGDYLQPGVHRVSVSLYGSGGPEIHLVP